jgi:hypothetical protein
MKSQNMGVMLGCKRIIHHEYTLKSLEKSTTFPYIHFPFHNLIFNLLTIPNLNQMKTKVIILFLLLAGLAMCTNPNKPLSDAEKDKIISEVKDVVKQIYQGAENMDADKLTSSFLNSPDFVSLINGEYANYEQTVKKYPSLMGEFKTQKPTILSEKFIVIDASTIVYTSKSKWECKLKNDSIAVYDNCGLQLILKKSANNWKVLNWSEVY